MNQMTHPQAPPAAIDADAAWAAFSSRDRDQDGRFVGAVLTTGIYCKPSCPARHPKRENVLFFPDAAAARHAGFRACLRCRPDEAGRDRLAVEKALALIAAAEEPLPLEALAEAVGYAPHHFHRLFKRDTGVTPAAYARKLRADRLETALSEGGSVTEAIYDAGYNAPSRAYADAGRRLGMTPSAWKNGGQGVTIRYTVADSSLGPMLIAATDRGLCRISFDEDETELERRFPNADILPADKNFADLAEEVVALADHPERRMNLPVDVQGTAFQQAVWDALRAIPPGQTRTYKQVAESIGKPGAVRATGTACGDNVLAVLVPCHRVLRSDGGIGGYAYGLERKEKLLERERSA
ncbi:bifunctional DNA-binding transcriptional regulator/O6-methylguanine-DNA methyltransferase Ada [Sphingobium phenoxybenzoativorans]|uniref:methylated-DNA--[protein]-cysteine S-methyltransferase n=1 Tax=Sphingobium phenoxybenzoativorans TaxID=1592790 RepID=A0A975K3Y6_9SPHN|nr:bifunctional DNA-binding transcriptional regulator/O6-methylguanine-DNA methyltransferase Ada [Sphingobium phenoxybenzoativorans]QUT04430.1 bifunctional DNA-binding transcriptional regulator/O6-methylguanine-DNA methyltransferase Ada [Sphingobium phenoxybenzoativorans]